MMIWKRTLSLESPGGTPYLLPALRALGPSATIAFWRLHRTPTVHRTTIFESYFPISVLPLIFHWFSMHFGSQINVTFEDFDVLFAYICRAWLLQCFFIDFMLICTPSIPQISRFYCSFTAKIKVLQVVNKCLILAVVAWSLACFWEQFGIHFQHFFDIVFCIPFRWRFLWIFMPI